MMKEKNYASNYIDKYMYLAHDVMLTKMSEKKGIKQFG